MIIEKVEFFETIFLEMIFFSGSVEFCYRVDDRLQSGFVIRIFDERLQHLRMSLRTRAQRVKHFPTNAFGSCYLRENDDGVYNLG